MNLKQIAELNTPIPNKLWINQSQKERLDDIKKVSESFIELILPLEARDNGHVIVKLLKEFSPGDRGTLLLDYEFHLKNKIDEAITIWIEPLGDKNTLRKLRGVEVKI